MKKFNIIISRIDEYIVEIDESVWTKNQLADFARVFYEFDDLEDMAKNICYVLMREGHGNFFEGFGHFLTYRQGSDQPMTQYHGLEKVTEYAPGIKVTIISEDDDFEYDITEND